MLRWFRPSPEDAAVRVGAPSDLMELLHLLRRSEHAHVHADWWPLDHYLAESPCALAEHRGQVVGVLACPSDPPPAAWVRALAVADGWTARPLSERLMAAALEELQRRGATELAVMHAEPWLAHQLPDLGFQLLTHVVTWRSRTLAVDGRPNPGVYVRPAGAEDLPALAAAEAQAFEPLWRLSESTLARMLEFASTFTVAEVGGVPAGYQFSSFYRDHGHLVRITVRPDLQGQGIGTALMTDLFRRAAGQGLTMMTLNTQQENATAQRLYVRFGFHITEERIPTWARKV